MDTTGYYYIAAALFLTLLSAFFFLSKKAEADDNTQSTNDPASKTTGPNGAARVPTNINTQQQAIRKKLLQAGFYGTNAAIWLSMVRMVTLIVPVVIALGVTRFAAIPIQTSLLIAVGVFVAGFIIPSFVLDHLKAARQKRIKQAIPDALDILSICLEAGLSLPASLAKVSQELASAHPEFATELAIADREMQLGRRTGESMRALAERFDIEELRSMANAISQSEKYGSSLVEALEVFSESMRQKRMFAAESLAQKAVVALLLPTVICILPAIFVVTLGPAAISIMRSLSDL